jgi:type VI secretion system secreted protein VgrG
VEFKASKKELAGPVSASSTDIAMKISEIGIKRDLEIEYIDADGNLLKDELIDISFFEGSNKTVTLDASGKAKLKNVPLGPFRSKQPKRR